MPLVGNYLQNPWMLLLRSGQCRLPGAPMSRYIEEEPCSRNPVPVTLLFPVLQCGRVRRTGSLPAILPSKSYFPFLKHSTMGLLCLPVERIQVVNLLPLNWTQVLFARTLQLLVTNEPMGTGWVSDRLFSGPVALIASVATITGTDQWYLREPSYLLVCGETNPGGRG